MWAAMAMGRARRWERVAVLLVLWLATFLRLDRLGAKSLWFDELSQVALARRGFPALMDQLPLYAGLPLDYALQALTLPLGLSEYALRFHAAWLGVATVPLLYVLARAVTGQGRVALAAAALLAFFPFHLQYAQEARPYALFAFVQCLALYSLWRAVRTGRRRPWLGFALAEALAFNTHYFALLYVAPLGLLALGWAKRTRAWRIVAQFAVGIAVAFLSWVATPWPAVALVLVQRALGLAPSPNIAAVGPLTVGEVTGGLQGLLLLHGRLGGVLALLLVIGIVTLWRRHAVFAAVALAWLLLPTALAALFFAQRGIPLQARFVIPLLPLYLLLLAVGVDGALALAAAVGGRYPLRRRLWPGATPWLYAALVALLLLVVSARTRAYYGWSKEPWREAMAFLSQSATPADGILVPHVESALDIYAPHLAYAMWEPKTLADVQAVARAHRRVWLVWSPHHDMGEENGARVLAWLQEHAAEFRGRHGLRIFLWWDGADAASLAQAARRLAPVAPFVYVGS